MKIGSLYNSPAATPICVTLVLKQVSFEGSFTNYECGTVATRLTLLYTATNTGAATSTAGPAETKTTGTELLYTATNTGAATPTVGPGGGRHDEHATVVVDGHLQWKRTDKSWGDCRLHHCSYHNLCPYDGRCVCLRIFKLEAEEIRDTAAAAAIWYGDERSRLSKRRFRPWEHRRERPELPLRRCAQLWQE